MTQAVYRSDMSVELVGSSADDLRVVQAARVSTMAADSYDDAARPEPGSPEDKLIRYLMRSRHGSPFEHTGFTFLIEAPIFVWREMMRHRIACLTGDTKIFFESQSGSGHWKTIEAHHEDWHLGVRDSLGRRRHLASVRQARVRSFDEDTHDKVLSDVLDVVDSGEKMVYRLTTVRGFTIKASADHPFFGPNGWVKLKDLAPGAAVFVQARSSKADHAPAIPPALRQGIQVWLTSVRPAILDRDGQVCANCAATEAEAWRVDHIRPVVSHLHLALDERNLQVLCLDCDRAKTSSEQILARRPGQFHTIAPDVITEIVELGIRRTYDLVLAPPHHNFLANGFVVHNSYNEESARYRQLAPVFYVPDADRALCQTGKAAHPQYVPGTSHQAQMVNTGIRRTSRIAYATYETLLTEGIAREVARMVLPLNIYSSAFVTMNARALMNFLSLRTERDNATFPSAPMREIAMVAEQMEAHWKGLMPLTHQAFDDCGRVAP